MSGADQQQLFIYFLIFLAYVFLLCMITNFLQLLILQGFRWCIGPFGRKDYAGEMELETRSVCAGEMEKFIFVDMFH